MAFGEVIPEGSELPPVPDVIITTAAAFAAHAFYLDNDPIHVRLPETLALASVIDRR